MKQRAASRKALVLYYAPEKTDMDRVIKGVLVRMGVRIRNVDAAMLGRTIGSLAGVPGVPGEPEETEEDLEMSGARENGEEDPIPEKVLVFCGFSRGKINTTLAQLNKEKVPRDIMKAALTMSNCGWSFRRLYRELSAERETLGGSKDDGGE